MPEATTPSSLLRSGLAGLERTVQTSPVGPPLRRLRSRQLDATVGRALRNRRGCALVTQIAYRTLLGRPPHRHEIAAAWSAVAGGASFTELVETIEQHPEARQRALARGTVALRDTLQERLSERPTATTGPRLVFLHIMKVGGSSLSDMVRRLVPTDRVRMHVFLDDLVLLPPQLLGQLALIGGHIPYEALPLIPGPYSTLTVLRDPYSRTLSHFAHLRDTRPAHRELTLDRFLHDEEFAALSTNYQARQLVHEIDVPGAWYRYSPIERCRAVGGDPEDDYPLQSLFDSAPLEIDDEDLFDQARKSLDSIDHVGITEALDETAASISRLFGAAPQPLPHLNSSTPLDPSELDTRLRRLIDERTAVDRELYELAAIRARSGS